MPSRKNIKMVSRSSRVEIVVLIALLCNNVLGFVPTNDCSTTTARDVSMSIGKSDSHSTPSSKLFSTASPLHEVQVKSRPYVKHSRAMTQITPVTATSHSKKKGSTPASKKKYLNKKSKQQDEFQWLNWVYRQWNQSSPGEISEEVLKQMVPAIASWSRRKSFYAAERSEELLNRIVEENLAGNEHAELTTTLFNSAMDAYGKIGNPRGVQRIFRRMKDLSKQHSCLKHLEPDNFTMSILATAWAKSRSPDAATKAEALLKYMEDENLMPNTVTYNTVLHALAVSDQFDKAVRAEDIVRRMKVRFADGEDCEPDIYSFQSLIQAWSRTALHGAPQRAEKILRFLDKKSEEGEKRLTPNAHCFTTTIHAWSRSSERNRARNAYQILNTMTKRYLEDCSPHLKPNVKTFTAVLNSCARPADVEEREDAFDIAKLTMAELSLGTYDKPNFLSFAAFLSVCCSTLPAGEYRNTYVKQCFDDCKKAGQVAQLVLTKLRIAATPDLFDELVGEYIDEDGNIEVPSSWTRYIKGERKEAEIIKSGICSKIPRSSHARLQAVQRVSGRPSVIGDMMISSSDDADGIEWSRKPLGFGSETR